jgi:hypothetical protein
MRRWKSASLPRRLQNSVKLFLGNFLARGWEGLRAVACQCKGGKGFTEGVIFLRKNMV